MQYLYDIVIIGGGPGGIGSVIESKALGLKEVLLIEKGDNHSQTIRKFYKDNKRVDKDYKGVVVELKGAVSFEDGTKESTLKYFEELLDSEEIDVIFNSEVEQIKYDGNIFKITTPTAGYSAKNVIIAIGTMGKPNKPKYKIPASIKDKINFNLNKCSSGEKILIVGGGNSAVEYALTLCGTNKITLAYRKEKFTRLNDENKAMLYEYNNQEKLRLRLDTDISSIENENGLVRINFSDGLHTIYDRIVYAIGGMTPIDFLKNCGVTFDENNKVELDENFQSKIKGLYLAGDIAVKKGGSIAFALSHAYHIITNILKNKV